jgi:uncharacterized OsmC-like protein
MAERETIKKAYERNRQAVLLRPEIGRTTAATTIRLHDGTTCEVMHKHWKFRVDIGSGEGGNDAGPGPGILERGALGSCLAIGYSQMAAVLDVPLDSVEVTVESDLDARGMLGIDERPPGFLELRCKVRIESPAPVEEVMKVIRETERHSPVLDDFRRPIPVKRTVTIHNDNEECLEKETFHYEQVNR